MTVRLKKMIASYKNKNCSLLSNLTPRNIPRETTGDHRRPRETTEDHKGQFPRTDTGVPTQTSPLKMPPQPHKATLTWGKIYKRKKEE